MQSDVSLFHAPSVQATLAIPDLASHTDRSVGGISKEKNAGDVHCLLQLLYPSPVSLLPCSHSAESKAAGLGVGGLWLHLSCRGCYEPFIYT